MKILVTGASGFIGRNLVEYLSERYEVLSPGRTELDLLEENSVDAYFRRHTVDVVIHAAGKPGHRNAVDLSNIFYADTRMYFNLVRNNHNFGRLLVTGSGGIYDLRKYRPKMKETEWRNNIPADEHGFFRYVTAHHIEATARVVDLRLFGVFGKYEDYAIRFISNAICKVLHNIPITIRQDRFFDYLYIDDFMQIIEYFISYDANYHEYNITPDKSVSLKWLAELIMDISGKRLPILITLEGLGLEYSGDNSRLKEEVLGLVFTPLEASIRQLYDWYEKNINNINRESLLIDK